MSNQRSVPFARPWITDKDRQAVLDVLEGHILTHGPQCKLFEDEFAMFLENDAHCVSVSSCMAALHLAYLHFGIGHGDEVIVPAQTHTATVHAVEWVGARPIFVDCDPHTGNITADAIEAAITPRTKAISVVHFVGIPCDMPSIMKVALRFDLKVIEDCAIALGARHQGVHVGLFGDAGCFSFYPVKHVTTSEGGMFVSKRRNVADAVRALRAFGVDRQHGERTIPGMYDVPSLGMNYRMGEMQAALGRSQLSRIEENLARRRANFSTLKSTLERLPSVRVLDSEDPHVMNSHYCLSAILEGSLGARRNQIVSMLNAAGVGTSIYYPKPVPRMTYYRRKYGHDELSFPLAEKLSNCSIALPVGPHLSREDVEYVSDVLETTWREIRA
jgi:dTDP-4-amino-4,6-dideoxygalactose transaminase